MRQLKLPGVCALQQFWHAADQVFQCSAPDVVRLDSCPSGPAAAQAWSTASLLVACVTCMSMWSQVSHINADNALLQTCEDVPGARPMWSFNCGSCSTRLLQADGHTCGRQHRGHFGRVSQNMCHCYRLDSGWDLQQQRQSGPLCPGVAMAAAACG